MRLLHGAAGRRSGAFLRGQTLYGRSGKDRDARGPRQSRPAIARAAGLHQRTGGAVRLLSQRRDHSDRRAAREEQESERGRDQEGACRQPLPLRDASAHDPRGAARGPQRVSGEAAMVDILGTTGTRRDFVKGALLVSFGLAGGIALARAQGIAAAKTVAIEEVDGFLAIGADGNATVYCGKVDLGTGVQTALTQIAAEELDLPIERITVIQGDTALTPDQGPTYASWSIQIGGMQLRQAAATARMALLEMSAQRVGVPATKLSTSNGTVTGAAKSISYGELVGGQIFARKVDKDAPVKDPATYTIVGKSVPRLDIRD